MNYKNQGDIPPPIFEFVEYELYNYDETKEELEDLREDIALSGVGNMEYDDFSSTEKYPEGSTTEASAIDLIQNKIANRMRKTIEDINNALSELDPNKYELYRQKYKLGRSWQRTVANMDISQATYFRWRNDIVRKVAEEMGLIQ